MSTFIERLVIEKRELDEKIVKLESFIMSTNFQDIAKKQRNLLQYQLLVMITYSDILTERILDLDENLDVEVVQTENPGLGYIIEPSYTLIDWTESEKFQEEEWFDEEAIENPEESNSYFIPTVRYFKFLNLY